MDKHKNYTPFQKLDNVLETLDHEDYYWSDIEDIIKDVDFITDEREIRLITTRLLKDDYIQSVPVNPNEYETIINKYIPNLLYYVTFNGQIHLKEGGYTQKIKDAKLQRNLRGFELWSIALGTSLSGLYCLGKLLLWLISHLSC